jgi:hypothetical protein
MNLLKTRSLPAWRLSTGSVKELRIMKDGVGIATVLVVVLLDEVAFSVKRRSAESFICWIDVFENEPTLFILMNSKISLTHTLELQLEVKIELN